MGSKSGLVFVVAAVVAFSIGAGSYLAMRANKAAGSETVPPVAGPTANQATAPPATQPSTSEVTVAAPVPRAVAEPRREVAGGTPRTSAPVEGARRTSPTQEAGDPPPVAVTTPTSPPAIEPPTPVTTPVTPVDATPVQEPPKPRFEDITVKEDTVIGIRLDQTVTSETAKLEDRVSARIARDVTVDGRTALAAGTRLEGHVTSVEKGGKFKERARLGIKFNLLILADGSRVPIQTEAILREGESPTGEATAKIGASAVVGAIIGAAIGGKKGAAIGTTAGAAGGTAVVARGDRNDAAFVNGSQLTVKLIKPVTITIERDPAGRSGPSIP